MITFFRRRGLGNTSCREMARIINEGLGGEARVVRNDRAYVIMAGETVVRWGCTSTVQATNVTVINGAASIHKCNDKAGTRVLLQGAGVPVPRTWVSFDEWIADVVGYGCFPVVVRPSTHSRGRSLLHTNHSSEVEQFLIRQGGGYISEYIPKVREVRVFVANGRAVWVAEKTPGNPDDVAWNVDQGGRFDNVKWSDWPMPAVRAAGAASHVIGADFTGVDVMLDADNNPYVLELNSAPSQTSPYRQLCSAKAFKWMHDHREETLPVVTEGGWKEYIHPAIRS
jgi:glutathione synthase/RimK-type ligase-like ATP-grasp enzyme